jgi:nicotinamidase-related amidase
VRVRCTFSARFDPTLQEVFAVAISELFEDHCWKDVIPPEDMATYASYTRETHIGTNPALLAVDLYNLVYKGGAELPHELEPDYPNSCGIYAHNAIEPTKKLFAAARAAGIPIFYVTAQYSPHRVQSTRRRGKLAVSEHDCEIHDAFAPRPEDTVFRKERPSAFFGTPLVAHLNQRRIDSLIVCGESTSGCVRASTLEAHMYGFHVSLVEECVFDRSEIIHKVNLFDMHHKYADVMKLNEVVTLLDQITGAKEKIA